MKCTTFFLLQFSFFGETNVGSTNFLSLKRSLKGNGHKYNYRTLHNFRAS